MGTGYEALESARHTIEREDGVEQVRIRARRNWFVLPFLCVWIAGWSAGGIAAIKQAMQTGEPFLFVWLILWAFGWVFAAVTIAWQLGGAELIRPESGDLAIGWSILGFKRWKRYRGADIHNLRAVEPAPFFRNPYGSMPLWRFNQAGTIRFDYGARTIHAGGSLDEAEGRMLVEWLEDRVQRGARTG